VAKPRSQSQPHKHVTQAPEAAHRAMPYSPGVTQVRPPLPPRHVGRRGSMPPHVAPRRGRGAQWVTSQPQLLPRGASRPADKNQAQEGPIAPRRAALPVDPTGQAGPPLPSHFGSNVAVAQTAIAGGAWHRGRLGGRAAAHVGSAGRLTASARHWWHESAQAGARIAAKNATRHRAHAP